MWWILMVLLIELVLFDIPMGGFQFTRAIYSGKKLSNLDIFFISKELLEVVLSLVVTVLPMWDFVGDWPESHINGFVGF
ncbi:hypothetical protein HanIR_Chr03g0139091 [Helianthus annuus]|nr:hypothetical protein HanIR_Chr03g0139091 [Helianthus annuus]